MEKETGIYVFMLQLIYPSPLLPKKLSFVSLEIEVDLYVNDFNQDFIDWNLIIKFLKSFFKILTVLFRLLFFDL